MKTILFQGDSITDAGRDRESDDFRGYGYATMVSGALGAARPGEFRFLNRGVSGDRSVDILGRVRRDIIGLRPDYMSILLGVNDVWHELDWGMGVDAGRTELYYDLLIEEVRQSLPEIGIMVLEPFLLKGSATQCKWEVFRAEVEKRAAVAVRVAGKHGLVFVPLLERFDEAQRRWPQQPWTLDGVHPTAMGHELIKQAWLEGFAALEK